MGCRSEHASVHDHDSVCSDSKRVVQRENLAPGMAPKATPRCSIYLSDLVGRTGFEPVTFSVSEKSRPVSEV